MVATLIEAAEAAADVAAEADVGAVVVATDITADLGGHCLHL